VADTNLFMTQTIIKYQSGALELIIAIKGRKL